MSLSHFRILFGGNHLYVFVNPNEKARKKYKKVTFDMAQQEIVKNSGLTLSDDSSKSTGLY